MSLDGSFTCESALRRLLARCPALRSDPGLASLVAGAGAPSAADVVESLAEVFLHPDYTIPIIGCFRPLSRSIVEKVIALLADIGKESMNSEFDQHGEEVGENDIRVVNYYRSRGRGLRIHELAALAFSRALDLAPFLLRLVLGYFKSSPPPFRRLELVNLPISQLREKDVSLLLNAIRVTYRLLIAVPGMFFETWDWSCFVDLAQSPRVLNCSVATAISPGLIDMMLDIRWCCIHILSLVLKLNYGTSENSGLEDEDALLCLLRWEKFCEDTSLEKAGWYLSAAEEKTEIGRAEIVDFSHLLGSFSDISSSSPRRNVCPTSAHKSVCRRSMPLDMALSGMPFIWTAAAKRSLEMVLLAVHERWPVLLYGPGGAGKTALINMLAQITGGRHVLFLHVDEQMDSKSLVGNYVCAEQPGEFVWQPGSLTQAIEKGFWVVFEGFDKAPNDVVSLILPLLEGSSSFVTGHGEAIVVTEGFQLFATISTSRNESSHVLQGSSLWRKVMVQDPCKEDLSDIIVGCYPTLQGLSSKIIETFERVNTPAASALRNFSLRDLLKWCKRIASLPLKFSSVALSPEHCRSIYLEAVDVFAAFLPCLGDRHGLMNEIASLWYVNVAEESLFSRAKPVVQTMQSVLHVGRIILQCTGPVSQCKQPFIDLRVSLEALEKIACSVKYNEAVLLVGETGIGKTTLVQNLATRLGQSLVVVNLSQQSDIADLIGGFKPTDSRSICASLYQEFRKLFCKTFSREKNKELLDRCETHLMERKWKKLLRTCKACGCSVLKNLTGSCNSIYGSKRKRPISQGIFPEWESLLSRLESAEKRIASPVGMSFTFVEGAFIAALRKGDWVLLDEVNLAPPEIMQRIIGVLDGEDGGLYLAERGDVNYIERHPGFRIFACMNPSTDVGKRELPYFFRSRFTEYFIDDMLDDEDLHLFVSQHLGEFCTSDLPSRICGFYRAAKRESEERLLDGAKQKPQFSLRSLSRALEYMKKARKDFTFDRALYDGFSIFFLTLLDGPSAKIMDKLIISDLLSEVKLRKVNELYDTSFRDYLVEEMKHADVADMDFVNKYVLTKTVKEHLKKLARAVYIKRYPVLLQGPTSSGKTSLVRYLAAVSGHKFVRINNHEHTDLQEYLGSYISDSHGKLHFQEGVLVKAVRKGHWIVLDELNLAPSDVLEALNRLLDDNRELFVPELQESIPAHPDFMLFATQNPPTFYGGRKVLSRAFRNRFVEIHVDEIPEDELMTIVEERCEVPRSRALKMVNVMNDLQLHRQKSKVFSGKHGFITPRDLFRWAGRFRKFGSTNKDLARDGYFLLAERLREESEKTFVRETLEKHFRVKIEEEHLYELESGVDVTAQGLANGISWTKSMRRLYFLLHRCYEMREPVLLVGETGCGKTTVCQLLSDSVLSILHILNCHQYTETSDFVGGFYPVRDRSGLTLEFNKLIERLEKSNLLHLISGDNMLPCDISQLPLILNHMNEFLDKHKQKNSSRQAAFTDKDLEEIKHELVQLHKKWQTLFVWQDGPLVQAMRSGHWFLVDEISLADDSVLERLNSALEPERSLSLAEKGGYDLEEITAHPNFFICATMNPGGDFGKKELSPALRNRFTEIWVPPVIDKGELLSIATMRLKPELSSLADCTVEFWEWFNQKQTSRVLTVRDLLSWVSFINETSHAIGVACAIIHGAFLVSLDGVSLGTGMSKTESDKFRKESLEFLLERLMGYDDSLDKFNMSKMENYGWGGAMKPIDLLPSEHMFGIKPFYIKRGYEGSRGHAFEFNAPTTSRNAFRVLRAMQLQKPILLEGGPGVGKTSLIVALAQYSGHSIVRINLSEQTDMMDLLGSDLPIKSENTMQFSWSDGILLQALKSGSWVMLDELNLAPQAVLEGLNSILDHRAEVYIPELNLTFECPPSFRIFACQNPSRQGGGRKALPKSFLNRFTKVYVDELLEDDYRTICKSCYPSFSENQLKQVFDFNKEINQMFGGEGSPWEFNLRDLLRSCQIIEGSPENLKFDNFASVLYVQRMRTESDREEVMKLYEKVFGKPLNVSQFPKIYVDSSKVMVGSALIDRNHFQPVELLKRSLHILPGIRHNLEAISHCLQQQWLCILVGPSSCGKTSLIRLLACLTGNSLHELNLSSGTDVSELLGCFEQYDLLRTHKTLVSMVEKYVNEYYSVIGLSVNEMVNKRRDSFAKWFKFLSTKNSWKCGSCWSLDPLVEIIEVLKQDMKALPVSFSYQDLCDCLKQIIELRSQMETCSSVKFEWVAGDLLKAIENGDWVVLENANLCNPTVLDRINSLVEPERSITINECGPVDGKPLMLRAHPRFRLFLTVNPEYGEISRAMRNRGVEIFVMRPNYLLNIGCEKRKSETEELNEFLVLSGIPIRKLIFSMSSAHMYAKSEGQKLGVSISLLELARWVELFKQLLMNGNQPLWSLHLSWEHTYLSSLGSEGWSVIMNSKSTYLSDWCKGDCMGGLSFSLPGGWPRSFTLRDLVWYSKEGSVRQNGLYLESLCAQYASYELSTGSNGTDKPNDRKEIKSCMIPLPMLYHYFFPSELNEEKLKHIISHDISCDFSSSLSDQMFFFAANWMMEQATARDLSLYMMWFQWHNEQLQPFCRNLRSFLIILREEREKKYPIWSCILDCWEEIYSHQEEVRRQPALAHGTVGKERLGSISLFRDAHFLPLLSLNSMEIICSDTVLVGCKARLRGAIRSLSLLRITLKQWNSEEDYGPSERTSRFVPFLGSLKKLETKMLEKIARMPELSFILSNILDHHILLWKGVVSCGAECIDVALDGLRKEALKLKRDNLFLDSVHTLCEGSSKLNYTHMKSLMWNSGSHLSLPSVILPKMQQLFDICNSIWSSDKCDYGSSHIKAVLSAKFELRLLAKDCLFMASYIAETEDNDDRAMHQLDIINDGLQRGIDLEMASLRKVLESVEAAGPLLGYSTSICCSFSPDILCREHGFQCWMKMLPLFDQRSLFLDIMLLDEISKRCLVDSSVLFNTNTLGMQHALDYSLNFSSRSPINFLPHQSVLRGRDARNSMVSGGISHYVSKMWLNWHSSLWHHSALRHLGSDPSQYLGCLTRTSILNNILGEFVPMKDYGAHVLKLRITSKNLWYDMPQGDIVSVLVSTARTLFEQIICAHKESFEGDVYKQISYILCEMANEQKVTQEKLLLLKVLLSSSSYFTISGMNSPLQCVGADSLLDFIVEPLIRGLYSKITSLGSMLGLGCLWLYIGVLRFLLLTPGGVESLDPAMVHKVKHSHILDKISSLELEIKVRQDCELISGQTGASDETERIASLEKLREELKQLKKVVSRREPSNYRMLMSECVGFLNLYNFFALLKDLNSSRSAISSADIQNLEAIACNWQVTSSSFIHGLSSNYPDYIDIIEQVQVAVYEMKLGLWIAVADAYERKCLVKVAESDVEKIWDAINSLVLFPKASPAGSCLANSEITERMLSVSSEITTSEAVTSMRLHASLNYIDLIQVAHLVCSSSYMDKASFELCNKIFHHFASLWTEMKLANKAKEDTDAQYYKFRPHLIEMKNLLGKDSSFFEPDSYGDISLEDGKNVEELVFTELEASKEEKNVGKERDDISEYIWDDVALVHDRLFGCAVLEEFHDFRRSFEDQRLCSFMESYVLGTRMTKVLHNMRLASLEDNLMLEHLLYTCLKHENIHGTPCRSYNWYKDSNAAVMHKMVQPLSMLQERVKFLQQEWPEHPGLQKILDSSEKLLGIPSTTPLSNALLGMQVLVSRAESFQESDSRFSLSEQLQPFYSLISMWQKLEVECWPTLLDAIQEQHEMNARKLWFPLYSVLHHNQLSDDVLIKSFEEFIQSSSLGEFKSRLRLLFSFHGHISQGICLKGSDTAHLERALGILYNFIGYYMQFMPLVLDQIKALRSSTEKELGDQLKLFNWDHLQNRLSIENFRRTRQKVWKVVHKFNDCLQQPVIVILNKEEVLKKEKVVEWLEQGNSCIDMDFSQFPFDFSCISAEKFSWYCDWEAKVNSYLQSESFDKLDGVKHYGKCAPHLLKESVSSKSFEELIQSWKEGYKPLDKICAGASQFGCSWKLKDKRLKRRLLDELLKSLEGYGLSRNKYVTYGLEKEADQMSSIFLHPSYDVVHLLLPEYCQHMKDTNIDIRIDQQRREIERDDSKWQISNKYYFKNLAMMQTIRQLCLNFHKDLTLKQVNQAVSFLNHLMIILQDQRYVAYNGYMHMRKLRELFDSLECTCRGPHGSRQPSKDSGSMETHTFVSPNQAAVVEGMWGKKLLFDDMVAMSKDMCLLLGRVKNLHCCKDVRDEADAVVDLIDKYTPEFVRAKKSLDECLFGSSSGSRLSTSIVPLIVSDRMESLVQDDCKNIMENFDKNVIQKLDEKTPFMGMKGIVSKRLALLMNNRKKMAEDSMKNQELPCSSIGEAFDGTCHIIMDGIEKISLFSQQHPVCEESFADNVAIWKIRFHSFMEIIHLNHMHESLNEIIVGMRSLANCFPDKTPFPEIELRINHVKDLLDIVLTFGEGILFEFLDVHNTIAMMTHMLGQIFAVLFSKGFGTTEDPKTSTDDGTKEATGTGFGEGEGANDVSEQVSDEAQLLGNSEKQDSLNGSAKEPNDKERGIEMDEDFSADAFSVSEDEEDGSEDDGEENPNLETAMGKIDGENVVDEKKWDKDIDDNPDPNEKYEEDPSSAKLDASSKDLRAKSDDALSVPESGADDESERLSEKEESRSPDYDAIDENDNDMNLDKKDAFKEPTGIQFEEQEEITDDVPMDEAEGSEEADAGSADEADLKDDDLDVEMEDKSEELSPLNDVDGKEEAQMNDELEREENLENDAKNEQNHLSVPVKGPSMSNNMEPLDIPTQKEGPTEAVNDLCAANSDMEVEHNVSNSNNTDSGSAPFGGMHSEKPELQFAMFDSAGGPRLSGQVQPPPQQDGNQSTHKRMPNPFRSTAQAMEESQRANVSIDAKETPSEEASDIFDDGSAVEYRYVSEAEKSSSHALGSATADQAIGSSELERRNADDDQIMKEDGMDCVNEAPAIPPLKPCSQSVMPRETEKGTFDAAPIDGDTLMEETQPHNESQLYVSFNSDFMNEAIPPASVLESESEPFNVVDVPELDDDKMQEATESWRGYERDTAIMSQQLAEQLRLVLEPTSASKLQGDYKTGKRINMKKVIEYIASHFRKDKFWMRRTKPSKRNYQVVVAIDDSISMQESNHGDIAIKALVTVCLAMSLLEVGQLAVASFGDKGNIKLLKDFDCSFDGEAGVKMISSLSFKHDNTLADEPVIGLLKYLNAMFDAAAAKSHSSSGQNPLHQLMLIIGDGRFHDKDSLKRCILDVMSHKRMVAFILLDTAPESIIDLTEASFENEKLCFKKYMASFPFPYYIILPKVEELPGSLAELLRQWFELMQGTY